MRYFIIPFIFIGCIHQSYESCELQFDTTGLIKYPLLIKITNVAINKDDQTINIDGEICDSTLNIDPQIVGAFVMVKGKNNTGIQTYLDGVFRLRKLDVNDTLLFRSFGYFNKEIPLHKISKMNY